MTAHVVSYSSGLGSHIAALRVKEREGRDIFLLFMDTLIEDEDNYRFLLEGAQDIYGTHCSGLIQLARDLTPAEDDYEKRIGELATLRKYATNQYPRLLWLSDGRNPWEVFRDSRFIGNSRIDPCSKILKRQLADNFMNANFSRRTTVLYCGIDIWEGDRYSAEFTRTGEPKLKERMAEKGWDMQAPLCEKPYIPKLDYVKICRERGYEPPRLYSFGLTHANCGGFCCKGGQSHNAAFLHHLPKRFAWHAEQEQKVREEIGNYSCMVEQVKGVKIPLTLARFAEEMRAGKQTEAESTSFSCGCFNGEN